MKFKDEEQEEQEEQEEPEQQGQQEPEEAVEMAFSMDPEEFVECTQGDHVFAKKVALGLQERMLADEDINEEWLEDVRKKFNEQRVTSGNPVKSILETTEVNPIEKPWENTDPLDESKMN